MASKVLQIKLSDEREMPMIGLGTYARQANLGQFRQAVEHAIDVGYRHIDTAACYNNEEEVGEGINNKIKAGVVTRDELFITTKLWNDSHAEEDVIPSLQQSLARLRLDYVDLYLIHWPVSVNVRKNQHLRLNYCQESANKVSEFFNVGGVTMFGLALSSNQACSIYDHIITYYQTRGVDTGIDYIETWKGMEQALKQGLTKSIGVSNFNEEQLERLLRSCTVKPVCNQFEINPTLTQHKLVSFCKQHSVVPMAYTPLGLISEARPEFVGKDVIKTDPKLGALAEKHAKTRAQIALRYLVQRGIPVLPKSFTKSRIEENFDIFDFELSEEEMKIVEKFNIDHRCVPGTAFKDFKYYPFI